MIGIYTICLFSAAIITIVGAFIFGRRQGIPSRTLLFLLFIFTISIFIGSRTLYVLTNKNQTAISFWDIEAHGFSLFGGLLLAIMIGYFTCRLLRVNHWQMADIVSPFIGIGLAITRIGCFMYGCCFGKETNLPWGVSFSLGSPAHLYQLKQKSGELLFVHPVHPTQLYELFAAIIGSILACILLRKKLPTGTTFLVFSLLFTSFRLSSDSLRIMSPSYTAPHYLYPAMYVLIIVMCIIFLWKKMAETTKAHSV